MRLLSVITSRLSAVGGNVERAGSIRFFKIRTSFKWHSEEIQSKLILIYLMPVTEQVTFVQ